MIFFVKIGNNIGNHEEETEEYSQYVKNKPNFKLCFKQIISDVTLAIINDLKLKSSSGIGEISKKNFKILKNKIATVHSKAFGILSLDVA